MNASAAMATLPAQRHDSAGRAHVDLPAILKLAAPLMATNAVQALLNLTDLWFIGRLSTDALAAMGAIYWILTCAILLFGGVGLFVEGLKWALIIALVLFVVGAFTGTSYRRRGSAL